MPKIILSITTTVTALAIIAVLLLPTAIQGAAATSATVTSSGYIQSIITSSPSPTPITTNNFAVKAAHVNLNNIMPGHSAYVPNWASLLHGMGVNTLRIMDGGEGRFGYNIALDANWAQNLEKVLTTIDAAGFKCYWQSMGTPWNTEFGIPDGRGGVGTISIDTAKLYIDKLAGNNASGHNFIADPRIVAWSIGNEVTVGTKASNGVVTTNSDYLYLIQLHDYIRSKGGKTIADCPIIDDAPVGGWGWDEEFVDVIHLFEGHADYFETHNYFTGWLVDQCYSGGTYNWAHFKTLIQSWYTTQLPSKGSFDMNHIIVGEFGMWLGTHSGEGANNWLFTEQNQADYYTAYYQALGAVGIKWACPYEAFMSGAHYYGIISAGTSYDTKPSGIPYSAYNVIAANYA
jgi:hypothetical protein